MSEIEISAVIPAYNAEGSIRDAVASMLGQSLAPVEVIVVDDGSHDATAEVATAAGARVIRQPNRGPSAARNAGIDAAATPWVALLDADDRSRPERLAWQAPAIKDGIDLVFANRCIAGLSHRPSSSNTDFANLWRRNCIAASTVLLRKAAWERIGRFDETPELIGAEEYNLWLRLSYSGAGFAYVDQDLVDASTPPTSLTTQTHRCAAGELLNIEKLAAHFDLPRHFVSSKERTVYLDFGLELFHARDLAASRHYLREAARRGPIGSGAQMRRIASYLPIWLIGRK